MNTPRVLKDTDNWIVIGTPRTGSYLVSRFISYCYKRQWIKTIFRNIESDGLPLEGRHILHTHSIEDLELRNKNTIVVNTKRCPVKSALSACIAETTDLWHIHNSNKEAHPKVEKFYLDPKTLLRKYKENLWFYTHLESLNIENLITLDFNKISVEDKYRYIFDTLNLPTFPITNGFLNSDILPLKSSTSHSDWIKNWEEIESTIKEL